MFIRHFVVGLLAVSAAALAATVELLPADIKFDEPFGVAFDKAGNTWVIEFKGNRLIRLDKAGKANVVAEGSAFREPHGVVINHEEQIFIADTHNNRVLKMDVATGKTSTVAGNGEKGFSGDGGPATKAAFNGIFAIDLSPKGDMLYIADLSNRRVRRVDLRSGIVTTVAGNGEKGVPVDGAKGAESPLVDPRAVTADGKGNVYILERGGNALRVVDKAGRIRTLIKPGDITPDLKGPKHLCLDRNGDVIIADAENHLVRRFSIKTGKTTTVAGTGEKGDRIDAANPRQTLLNRPHGVFVHKDGTLYITDSYNHRILKVRGF
ncbi:MAG: hypothetical protein JNN08_19690 [Bryobacterales bacterium]|nr:hypothetical protein [Bryobacterales bacterium]